MSSLFTGIFLGILVVSLSSILMCFESCEFEQDWDELKKTSKFQNLLKVRFYSLIGFLVCILILISKGS